MEIHKVDTFRIRDVGIASKKACFNNAGDKIRLGFFIVYVMSFLVNKYKKKEREKRDRELPKNWLHSQVKGAVVFWVAIRIMNASRRSAVT